MLVFDEPNGVAVAELETMAKKKSPPAEEKPKSKQAVILAYKADPAAAEAVKAWLQGLADHVHAPVTVAVDQALAAFAVSHGYKKPMPKRLAR